MDEFPTYDTRYDCTNCSRSFMSTATARKVNCPHCKFLNVFVPDPEVVLPPWVAKEIPIYTPEEASVQAQQLLNEDPLSVPGWEKIDVTYEGIEGCYAKVIAINQNKENVYATKASAVIEASAQQIFNTYWDVRAEMQWNTATLVKIQILHDDFSNQLVLQQHKKVAAINLQNDLAYRRFYEEHDNGQKYWVYSVSEKTTPESQPGWVRGRLVLGAFLVETIAPNKCKVSLLWSFDINKKLSVKYKDDDVKKTPLRLCKIKKKIEDEARLAARTREYEAQKKGF